MKFSISSWAPAVDAFGAFHAGYVGGRRWWNYTGQPLRGEHDYRRPSIWQTAVERWLRWYTVNPGIFPGKITPFSFKRLHFLNGPLISRWKTEVFGKRNS